MSQKVLKIGARGSPLSLAQTELVARAITAANPDLVTEVVAIKTTGDKLIHANLSDIGGKGVFVKEIEEALLNGAIDLAVHSAKDLPSELPPDLVIGAVPERADYHDLLITRWPGGLAALPQGARVGTSGLRRQAQLLAARPDLKIEPIRGNVATRLKKVRTVVEATLLAAAGLSRLGLTPENAEQLPTDIMLPSPGQGTLALEVRRDNLTLLEQLMSLDHRPTALALAAERGFLSRLGTGCQLPVAALAHWNDQTMDMEGLIASADGTRLVRGGNTAELDSPEAAANFGKLLATELLAQGGAELMKELK